MSEGRRRNRPPRAAPAMVAIIGAFALVGVVTGAAWSWLGTPAEPIKMWMSEVGPVVVEEAEAGRLFAMDGWFAALGVLAGVFVGVLSYVVFRHHGPWTVVGLTVGSLIGAGVTLAVGTLLAEDSLVLAWKPQAEQGTTLQAPLHLQAYGVVLVWPLAALLPVLVLVWLGAGVGGDRKPRGASVT